ncbi:MAG: DNA ligase [Deltaproteobacteria bacterium]|nr:DNA ligase [Deltaproteobacteria bacterium]
MKLKHGSSIVLILTLIMPCFPVFGKDKPDIMLAKIYERGIDVTQYWVSEKLDGVRARWDGTQLISRGGLIFATPDWFTQGFPPNPLDGELWTERSQYENVSSIVRKHQPHKGWRSVRFMVFDLPAHGGMFDERVQAMKQIVLQTKSPYLGVIEQWRVGNENELKQRLQSVIDRGGEGLMLHRNTARYASGRSHDLLKLKPFSDAEATVIGSQMVEGQAIYVWLGIEGVAEPRAYALPWDEKVARQLHGARRNAEASGTRVKMRNPFEQSNDKRERIFYAAPQPPPPEKQRPVENPLVHQRSQASQHSSAN